MCGCACRGQVGEGGGWEGACGHVCGCACRGQVGEGGGWEGACVWVCMYMAGRAGVKERVWGGMHACRRGIVCAWVFVGWVLLAG